MADGVGKHSKGERWELLQSMTGAWFIYPAGAAGLSPIEPKVRLPKKGATAEMFSRARLMAKAPELAEALRASLKVIDEIGHETTCGFSGCTCGQTEKLKLTLSEFRRLYRGIATSLLEGVGR